MKMSARNSIAIAISSLILSFLVSPTAVASTTYLVGDTGPAGGKIFITPLTSGNTTGLYFEAAPEDVSASRYLWCNSSDQTIPSANGSEIGTGETNTQAMLDHGCTSGAGYEASQYSLGGYTDWFLPSESETVKLQNLYGNGLFTGIGLDGDDMHWTSTWANSTESYVWYPYLAGAGITTSYSLLGGGFFVRAVRSFFPGETLPPSTPDDDAIARENDRKRQEAIANARAEIIRKVIARVDIEKGELQAAEVAPLSGDLLQRANLEMRTLETATAITFPRINTVIAKYECYAKISGELPGRVYSRDLVINGLLRAEIPMKSLIAKSLIELAQKERDTLEEIDLYLAKESATLLLRKSHLKDLVKKLSGR